MTDAAHKPWALVTGASDGIGVEFCRVLAPRGWNMVLVARREQKLRELASSLRAEHGAASEVIPCDLAEPNAAQALHRKTKDLGIEVDLLVNNAGLLQNGFFDEIDLAKQQAMLAVNVFALTSLTHLYLNDMLARGRGGSSTSLRPRRGSGSRSRTCTRRRRPMCCRSRSRSQTRCARGIAASA
jgi:short-subunit dehydrogenase